MSFKDVQRVARMATSLPTVWCSDTQEQYRSFLETHQRQTIKTTLMTSLAISKQTHTKIYSCKEFKKSSSSIVSLNVTATDKRLAHFPSETERRDTVGERNSKNATQHKARRIQRCMDRLVVRVSDADRICCRSGFLRATKFSEGKGDVGVAGTHSSASDSIGRSSANRETAAAAAAASSELWRRVGERYATERRRSKRGKASFTSPLLSRKRYGVGEEGTDGFDRDTPRGRTPDADVLPVPVVHCCRYRRPIWGIPRRIHQAQTYSSILYTCSQPKLPTQSVDLPMRPVIDSF